MNNCSWWSVHLHGVKGGVCLNSLPQTLWSFLVLTNWAINCKSLKGSISSFCAIEMLVVCKWTLAKTSCVVPLCGKLSCQASKKKERKKTFLCLVLRDNFLFVFCVNQHYSIVLCGIRSSVCLLSLLRDPNDVIKTTKVKVAAFRAAVCPSHQINCTLKFSINTGGAKKTKANKGPVASKQLVASQVTPPPPPSSAPPSSSPLSSG